MNNRIYSFKELFTVFALGFAVMLSSCATQTKIQDIESPFRQWEGKMSLQDLGQNKKYTFDVDIIARYPDRMRLEVTTSLGIHLASCVLNQEVVSCALHRDKKYLTGSVEGGVLEPILKVKMNPKFFLQGLFEQIPDTKDWSCTKGVDGNLLSCMHLPGKIKISWGERSDHKSNVKIEGREFALNSQLKRVQPKIQGESVFNLSVPKNYTSHLMQ